MMRTGRIGVALGITLLSGALGLVGAQALEIRLEDHDTPHAPHTENSGALPERHSDVLPDPRPGALPEPNPGTPPYLHVALREEGRAGDFAASRRLPSPAFPPSPESPARPTAALPLRLVDAGAVGIDADPASWRGSYSHGTGAFHSLIDPGTSDVDADAVRTIGEEWEIHTDRMAGFGNNAVAVGAFLELITFEGAEVYDAESPFPARHRALREVFADLFATAGQRGLDAYLRTDMLALTPPLERALRRRTGGTLDTTHPALWGLYAQGLDELFTALPDVAGVVIRVGEAGALYNRADWPYASRMGVQEPEELTAMLEGLLPTFERHGRTLILRSWSVGLGGLGHLHTDPEVYHRVLGSITSPNLVVSTKYTRGDYFSHLPDNPTLATPGPRRLVEFQARREFEGFSAFPNFLGGDHGRALRGAVADGGNIVGSYLWSQEGGPLHSGPRSLYPLHGFWSWIDANVHATSMLALDPTLDEETLARMWVTETISDDPRVVEGLTDLLLRSRNAVQKGLYIRPFAERAVRSVGVEVPPMMWIMEWDVVGDWRAVSSTVYRASRGELEATIDEGFEAVGQVRAMRASLERAAAGMKGDPRLPAMRRSLEYQESLFTTLAWWRSALLSYYGWLEHGDERNWTRYERSAERVRESAAAHTAGFEGDLDFPAYDFAPALTALERHRRNPVAADTSRMLLLTWLLAGGAAIAIGRRGRDMVGRGRTFPGGRVPGPARHTRIPLAFALVPTIAATFWLLMAFEGGRGVAALLAMLVAFPAVLALGWKAPGRAPVQSEGRGQAVWARTAPVLWPLALAALPLLAIMAFRGPDLFWFLFWSHTGARAILLALIPATILGMGAAALRMGGDRNAGVGAAAGSLLLAGGTALVILTLALPDLASLLSTLDDPLSFLPMRLALIVAVTAYAGVPTWITLLPGAAGAAAMALGGLLLWQGRVRQTHVGASHPPLPVPVRRRQLMGMHR